MRRNRSNQRGVSILAALIVGLLVSGLVYVMIRGITFQRSSGTRAYEMGNSYKTASQRLFELMDRPWNSPDLAPNVPHSDPANGINWEVKAVPGSPRLLRISVHADFRNLTTNQTSGARQGIAIGYKYRDF